MRNIYVYVYVYVRKQIFVSLVSISIVANVVIATQTQTQQVHRNPSRCSAYGHRIHHKRVWLLPSLYTETAIRQKPSYSACDAYWNWALHSFRHFHSSIKFCVWGNRCRYACYGCNSSVTNLTVSMPTLSSFTVSEGYSSMSLLHAAAPATSFELITFPWSGCMPGSSSLTGKCFSCPVLPANHHVLVKDSHSVFALIEEWINQRHAMQYLKHQLHF